MNEPVVHARIEPGEGGRLRVVAPGIGVWGSHPHPGALVGPGSEVGTLERLNHRYRLVLPDGAAGRVATTARRDRAVPVEYGETLFELLPIGDLDADDLVLEGRASGASAGDGVGEGMHAILAPTDGVFYRSPRPGAPPFVKPGDRVREGQPVGLVEVMKTFSQVFYGGPGFPGEAEVVEVRAEDGAEIKRGQVLLVTR